MQVIRYHFDISQSNSSGESLLSFCPESQFGHIVIDMWNYCHYLKDDIFADPLFVFPESSTDHQSELYIVEYCKSHAHNIVSGFDKYAHIHSIGVNVEDFSLTLKVQIDNGRHAHFRIANTNLFFYFSVYEDDGIETERYSIHVLHDYRLSVTAYRHRRFCKDTKPNSENPWLWVKKFEIDAASRSRLHVREAHRYDDVDWTRFSNSSPLLTASGRMVSIDVSIDKLGLTTRTKNCLKNGGIDTILDVLNYPHCFGNIRGFGPCCAKDLEEKMHKIGYDDFTTRMK